MTTKDTESRSAWTVEEAKANLPEILKLAESEGPQMIGDQKCYVIVPEEEWVKQAVRRRPSPMPMGQYLLERMPRGIYSNEPFDRGLARVIPFVDYETEEEWLEAEGGA